MKSNLLLIAVAVAAFIQLLPAPSKTNPPVEPSRTFHAAMKPPQPVSAILDRACLDCHSNETKWPWYSNIAPVSWLVRSHVDEGRKHLNLSEWLKPDETAFSSWSDLEGVCTSVRDGNMPLPYYDWLHPEAKLSPADRQALCAWVNNAIANAGR